MNEDWSAETEAETGIETEGGNGAGTEAETGVGTEAEADLVRRLTEDLGAFDVGAAPIGPAMGWGKAMKTRRRATQAGVLSAAAVAVAGVVLPFALRSRPVEPPLAPWNNHPATAPHKVTVDPTRTASDGAPIWSGSIDGVRWSVQAGALETSLICVTGGYPCTDARPDDEVGTPVGIEQSVTGRDVDAYLIGMAPAVTSVDVYLDDGTDLRLQPTPYQGHHLAVLRLPHSYPIDHIVAHLPTGDKTTVALNFPNGSSAWAVWYPSAAVPDGPSASGVVASRAGVGKTTEGAAVTAYVGPFGIYIDESPIGFGPSESHPSDGLDVSSALGTMKIAHGSEWAANEVTDAVDHVVLEFPDGTHQVVTPVDIGGHRFVGAYLDKARPPLRAVSYNAAGAVLAVSDVDHGPDAAATPSTP